MKKTLEKKSGIFKLKSKFFINRAVIYSFFLLIPVWIPRILMEAGHSLKLTMVILYSVFMTAQWFLLGKEIDHRLKIYFTVNSSIDRLLYRLLLGMVAMLLYFNLLTLLPQEVLKHWFWGTWIVFGLFYSWPTRGKIVEETFTKQLTDFRFLDSFEKTIFFPIMLFFAISLPPIPSFGDVTVLQLFYDPMENMSGLLWNFLWVNFFPFIKYPSIYRMAVAVYFYLIGTGLFLLSFYAFLRFFVSRRSAMLALFALISSWSFCQIAIAHPGAGLYAAPSMMMAWSFLWVLKSATYRTGLLLGLLGFWMTLLDDFFVVLLPLELLFIYIFFLRNKTRWYKRQVIKYSLLGLVLSLAVVVTHGGVRTWFSPLSLSMIYEELISLLLRKSFFILAPLGMVILLLLYIRPLTHLRLDQERGYQLMAITLIIALLALFRPQIMLSEYALMWPLSFLSILPIEWPFQLMGRFRSQRNMVYLIYILICLLDSHIEGRIKNLIGILYGP